MLETGQKQPMPMLLVIYQDDRVYIVHTVRYVTKVVYTPSVAERTAYTVSITMYVVRTPCTVQLLEYPWSLSHIYVYSTYYCSDTYVVLFSSHIIPICVSE